MDKETLNGIHAKEIHIIEDEMHLLEKIALTRKKHQTEENEDFHVTLFSMDKKIDEIENDNIYFHELNMKLEQQIKEAEKTLIKIKNWNEDLATYNPSITDFIKEYFGKHSNKIARDVLNELLEGE